MTPSQQLKELNITLPSVAKPIGSYIPAIKTGQLILTSGQLPAQDGQLLYTGKVPGDVTLADAAKAAEIAVLNALAAIANIAGGVDNIQRIVRVCVYVASDAGFTDQPKVANGASDLLGKVFGDAGQHVRSAVGAAELPLNAPVEVELVVEVAH